MFQTPVSRPWPMPEEIRSLPFDLLRSQNYPLLASTIQAAIIAQTSPGYQQTAVYLPQRMGFRRWKKDADGVLFGPAMGRRASQDWHSVVTSAVRSFRSPTDLTGGAPRTKAPAQPILDAARARFDHLPRAVDKMSTAQWPGVPSLPARTDRIPPFALDDLARRHSTFSDKVESDRFGARARAMQVVEGAHAVIRRAVFGR